MQPGQVIVPGGVNTQKPSVVEPAAQPAAILPPPVPTPSPSAQPEPVQLPQNSDQPNPIAQPQAQAPAYTAAAPQNPSLPLQPQPNFQAAPYAQEPQPYDENAVTWNAAEFVQHEKNATWYGAYTLGAIVLSALIFLFTRDVISTAVVFLAVAGLIFFASRQPHDQQYALEAGGLHIGTKTYYLEDFKAFSVAEDAHLTGITLLPLKRFMPPITVYVAPEQQDSVVGYLSDYLPSEVHKADAIDSLLRRIRF